MKKNATIYPALMCLTVLLCGASSIGCSSSSAAGASPFDTSQTGALNGNWEYFVTNAYGATFENCTGDAAALEGYTFAEANALAPMCLQAVRFKVNQLDDSFHVVPHGVTCSDGISGSATGTGKQINATDIVGQWQSASSSGVVANQVFSGSLVGDTIAIVETARTFTGSFEGSCDLSPPLKAAITVIQ